MMVPLRSEKYLVTSHTEFSIDLINTRLSAREKKELPQDPKGEENGYKAQNASRSQRTPLFKSILCV